MESNKLSLIGTILRYGLGVVGVILAILIFTLDYDTSTSEGVKAMMEDGIFSSAIGFFIILFIAGLVLVLAFFLLSMVTTPKKTVLSIIGILIAGVLYLVLYLMGTSDTQESLKLADPVSDSTLAATSAGLYLVGICLFVGMALILFGPLLGKYRK